MSAVRCIRAQCAPLSRQRRPFLNHHAYTPATTPAQLNTKKHSRPFTASPLAPRTLQVPPGAWDSHMHVLEANYPLAPDAIYAPHLAPLAAAQANAARLSLPNLVFVQASPHGTDNSCQLDGLARHGLAHGRAVVALDPATATLDDLQRLHARGARGVRVNLKSVGRVLRQAELDALLRGYARLLRPLGSWCVQVYVDLHVVPQLEALVEAGGLQGVTLVIDHLGGPPEIRRDMGALPGWASLLRLLERPDVYVKVSAPYRFTPSKEREEFYEFEPVVKPLLKARGGKGVVFASDWPHTRHEYTDAEPWVQRCLEWCGEDERLRDDLFRDNARRLWDAAD